MTTLGYDATDEPTPPKYAVPLTNTEIRSSLLHALSTLRSALNQMEYIPPYEGSITALHRPVCIARGHIREARRTMYTIANNLAIPEDKGKTSS